ncbi:hypothetical protein ACRU3B_18185 [Mycobacterium colombiense]
MRLSGDERVARDTLVLRMYLAGVTYRDIGRKVGLSVGGVHKVIKRQLRQSADRRDDLADDAVESYLARMEALLAANWGKALRGDTRSLDQCRRMLDSMARVQGIVPSLAERVLPERIRDDDDRGDDDGDDELEAWRKRREQPGYTGSYGLQEMDGGA